MKRIFLVLITTLMLFGGVAMADFIDHPMYSKINTFTASVVSQISDAQDAFFIQNGRYFQGLWILGDDSSPDGITDLIIDESRTPDDFGVAWKDFMPTTFKKNIKIPVNIKIDVYESPKGWGWVFRADAFYPGLGPDEYGSDGDHWIYIHDDGPDGGQGYENKWFILGD